MDSEEQPKRRRSARASSSAGDPPRAPRDEPARDSRDDAGTDGAGSDAIRSGTDPSDGTPATRHHRLRRFTRFLAGFLLLFALVVLLRTEILEGYQIPTHSMEPVLRGDPLSGDKVLVYKKPFLFREPRRWEIVAFRRDGMPHAIVKRIAGLPGESLWIGDGDVYIDGEIARKPWSVQRTMLIPVYDQGIGREPLTRAFEPSSTVDIGWNSRDGSLVVPPGAAVDFVLRDEVRDSYVDDRGRWRSWRNPVGDLLIEVEVTPASGAGAVVLGLRREGARFELTVPVGGGPAVLDGGSEGAVLLEHGDALRAGERHTVRFSNIDLRLRLRIDDEDLYTQDLAPIVQGSAAERRTGASFGVRGGGIRIHDVRLYRDVYYTSQGQCAVDVPVLIPGDGADRRFFVLGDNSVKSKDSRCWGDPHEATIPFDHLIGVPVAIFWPPARMRVLD